MDYFSSQDTLLKNEPVCELDRRLKSRLQISSLKASSVSFVHLGHSFILFREHRKKRHASSLENSREHFCFQQRGSLLQKSNSVSSQAFASFAVQVFKNETGFLIVPARNIHSNKVRLAFLV